MKEDQSPVDIHLMLEALEYPTNGRITQTQILNNAIQKLEAIEAEPDNGLSAFEHLRITAEKDIPQPEPTVKINSAAIASPGNITAIGAAAKAGKTAVVGVLLAGAISKNGLIDGFSEISISPNPEGKAVISLDTEQSEADQQYNVRAVLKRAGISRTPTYFRAYNIRQLKTEEYQATTNAICDLCRSAYKGIHLIVIDGGADFILSVNDESAASSIVQYFTHLAIKYQCAVIVIVHQNPGSEKERGHFGSEIQRKCYGLLTLTREGDVSTLKPKIMRKAGNADIPLIHFKFCKDKGYHVEVESTDSEEERAVKERKRHKEIAIKVFKPLVALSYTKAVSQIMQETNRGERTAKTMISNMIGWEYINKGDDNNYRINL